jgi:hypothetical protein
MAVKPSSSESVRANLDGLLPKPETIRENDIVSPIGRSRCRPNAGGELPVRL